MQNTIPHAAFAQSTSNGAFPASDRERLKRNGCPERHLTHYAAQIRAQAKPTSDPAWQYKSWFIDNHPGRELPDYGKPVKDVAEYFTVQTDAEGLAMLTSKTPARRSKPKGPTAAQWRKLMERVLACDESAIKEAMELVKS